MKAKEIQNHIWDVINAVLCANSSNRNIHGARHILYTLHGAWFESLKKHKNGQHALPSIVSYAYNEFVLGAHPDFIAWLTPFFPECTAQPYDASSQRWLEYKYTFSNLVKTDTRIYKAAVLDLVNATTGLKHNGKSIEKAKTILTALHDVWRKSVKLSAELSPSIRDGSLPRIVRTGYNVVSISGLPAFMYWLSELMPDDGYTNTIGHSTPTRLELEFSFTYKQKADINRVMLTMGQIGNYLEMVYSWQEPTDTMWRNMMDIMLAYRVDTGKSVMHLSPVVFLPERHKSGGFEFDTYAPKAFCAYLSAYFNHYDLPYIYNGKRTFKTKKEIV